jgi:hypothetical protein
LDSHQRPRRVYEITIGFRSFKFRKISGNGEKGLRALQKRPWPRSDNMTAYLIRKGKTVEEVLALIKAKRPAIYLEDTQREELSEFFKKVEKE